MRKIFHKRTGITLIALIITIIILLILVGVSVVEFHGEGIIASTVKAKFYTEMNELKEKKYLSLLQNFTEGHEQFDNDFLDRNLRVAEIKDFNYSLKAEIIYLRNAFGNKERFTTKQLWDKNMFECQDVYANEDYIIGLTGDIYYITENASGKEKFYIYDSVSDVCFRISPTRIGKFVVHSLEYAQFIIDGLDAKGVGIVDDISGITQASDGTLAYEPDLNNFSYATQIVYYSEDMQKEHRVSIEEFIKNGKKNTININGENYTFASYTTLTSGKTQIWANIVTKANGLEAYWVWIPRFAYKLNKNNGTSDIIFVDINNNKLDGTALPEGYKLHEAFTQKEGLKGIWFSKYDPSGVETIAIDQAEPNTPNLSNFNKEKTKIIYYTLDGSKYIERDCSDNPAQSIVENGTTYYWYNYKEKIWANVKTTANDLEAYWVWIPRFAYKIESGATTVVLVDKNNKPIDTNTYGSELPEGYRLHEAFNQQDSLEGIWFSKYDPTSISLDIVDNAEPNAPNVSNFNKEKTKIIYYTLDGSKYIERDCSDNPAQSIVENGITYYWYNYTNKIWANVKTIANDLEAYWVWIPRFAYKIESGITTVILIDTNNQPIDKNTYGTELPAGYKLHEAFNQQDGLEGIWFSKYDPTKVQ